MLILGVRDNYFTDIGVWRPPVYWKAAVIYLNFMAVFRMVI
jgi:hypothetical protein